jgi:hypothetical protein
MLAAAVTELLELETAGGRLFVLRRRVVPLLALSALQCDNFPHFLILTDPAFRFFFAGYRDDVESSFRTNFAAFYSLLPVT